MTQEPKGVPAWQWFADQVNAQFTDDTKSRFPHRITAESVRESSLARLRAAGGVEGLLGASDPK